MGNKTITCLHRFKWYRKYIGGLWYKHKNNYQLSGLFFNYFWAQYPKINRYTDVVESEHYKNK